MTTSENNSQVKLRLIVDNTPIVDADAQPFDDPVIVTRDEMNKLRDEFNHWFQERTQHG